MTAHRHTANPKRGSGAGGRQKAALARLHSAGVAKSRRTASLPGAGGRHLPLWGGAPSENGWCTVERSGNGKTLRFVRHTPNTSTVFRTCSF